MTAISADQREMLQAAGWTEKEAVGFAQTLVAFRDSLPARQRDAFNGILTAARVAVSGDDVQGHLVVIAVIAVLMGLLLPAVQKEVPQQTSVPGSVLLRRG